jgi:hypothetical protein
VSFQNFFRDERRRVVKKKGVIVFSSSTQFPILRKQFEDIGFLQEDFWRLPSTFSKKGFFENKPQQRGERNNDRARRIQKQRYWRDHGPFNRHLNRPFEYFLNKGKNLAERYKSISNFHLPTRGVDRCYEQMKEKEYSSPPLDADILNDGRTSQHYSTEEYYADRQKSISHRGKGLKSQCKEEKWIYSPKIISNFWIKRQPTGPIDDYQKIKASKKALEKERKKKKKRANGKRLLRRLKPKEPLRGEMPAISQKMSPCLIDVLIEHKKFIEMNFKK